MPAIVLLGAQWGDEGKGKATDLLGASVDYVVKYNGGNNAGHTVVIGDEKYALHLLPSGILTPGVTPVIGNGVVIDLRCLFEELDALEARGVDTSRLLVSASAHLIAPYHTVIDKVAERFLGKARLGTTGRGIGPTYADKMSRVGVRVQDLFDEKILRQKVEGALEQKNHLLVKVYNRRAITVDEVVEEFLGHADRLRPMVADTALVLGRALDDGRTVLLEGGQATLLDVDHGTYPFVTSSNPTAGGACTGSGIPPTRIDRVIAVVKAYATRVGSGPFPTELLDADGERLRARRRGVRHHDRPAAPLRLVRRRRRPLRRPRQRRHRLRAHQARRAHRVGAHPGLRRLRRRRRPAGRDADDADRLPPRQAGLRGLRRLGRGHLRRPLGRATCRRRRRSTCRLWRTCPAPRSRRSGSGPAATRRSRSGPCSAERAITPDAADPAGQPRGGWTGRSRS